MKKTTLPIYTMDIDEDGDIKITATDSPLREFVITKKTTYYFNYTDKIYYIYLTVDEFKELNLPVYPEFINDEQFELIKKYFKK